jgi:mono/diheme cytochrome c family protein
MMKRLLVIVAALTIALVGCTRERPSTRPPIHPNLNMDFQPKYYPQARSDFFADGAAMRPLVPGTVARGWLRDDDIFWTGRTPDGAFVAHNPLTVDMTLLKRGRQRFDIYCSPCHSKAGDGHGIMVQRGYVPPPSFHTDLIRGYPDGHIFDVITHGIRNMPSYAGQIPVHDRWAIVAYLRALQRSQNATLNDVPPQLRETVTKRQ